MFETINLLLDSVTDKLFHDNNYIKIFGLIAVLRTPNEYGQLLNLKEYFVKIETFCKVMTDPFKLFGWHRIKKLYILIDNSGFPK